MKLAIFSTLVSFALLANGAVLPKKGDVTTQEINKLISDLIKNQVDAIVSRQPLPASLGTFSVKTDKVDVQVEIKDGQQNVGPLSSQSQSSSMTESAVSASVDTKFTGLAYFGPAEIKGTINQKPVDLKAQITMVALDLSVSLDVEAEYDSKSVRIVDFVAPVTKGFNPIVKLSDVQIKEVEVIEKGIEDGLKKRLEDAQKAIDAEKAEAIAHINKELKGKTLRDVIDFLSSLVPAVQFTTLIGF